MSRSAGLSRPGSAGTFAAKGGLGVGCSKGTSAARPTGASFGRCDKAAAMKHQGGFRLHVAAFHFANENDMVSLWITAAVMAFEPGRSAFEDRKPGMGQFEI